MRSETKSVSRVRKIRRHRKQERGRGKRQPRYLSKQPSHHFLLQILEFYRNSKLDFNGRLHRFPPKSFLRFARLHLYYNGNSDLCPSPLPKQAATEEDHVDVSTMGALPEGWSAKKADDGRIYYIDHETKRTQWEHPVAKQVLFDCLNFVYPSALACDKRMIINGRR
jgi:hypothetical protein